MTEHSGRFAITPARAVEDHRLGDAAYRVLACLGTYADKDGWCWPSMPTLADRLGRTRQAVQRSIRQLADLAYVEVERRHRSDGTQDRNRYRLLFDRALFEVRNQCGIDSPAVPQPDVAGGQPDVAGPQRGRQGDRNVGDTPYIEERTHNNVHGRSDDRHDETAKQFDEFWRIFPSRGRHTNPKKPARERFFAAVKRGVDPELIVQAASNYAAHIVRSNTAARYVKQGQVWLSQECWEQYGAPDEPESLRAGMI